MSELKLEVGKSYVNRRGDIVKIIDNDGHRTYPFNDKRGESYMPNGRSWSNRKDEPTDIISEAPCGYDFEMASQHEDDAVNHPPHYTSHPSGIECIQVTEHMGFCIGNAIKYLWRADLKHDAVEDMRKAIWYIEREIERRESAK